MMNPDGYSYTHHHGRFWSKNRRPSINKGCVGVNLNRNFPSHWNYGPADPCDRSYRGPFPASESEVKAVINYVETTLMNRTILMAISLHAFGQVVFLPYAGSQQSVHPNQKVLLSSLMGNVHDFLIR